MARALQSFNCNPSVAFKMGQFVILRMIFIYRTVTVGGVVWEWLSPREM